MPCYPYTLLVVARGKNEQAMEEQPVQVETEQAGLVDRQAQAERAESQWPGVGVVEVGVEIGVESELVVEQVGVEQVGVEAAHQRFSSEVLGACLIAPLSLVPLALSIRWNLPPESLRVLCAWPRGFCRCDIRPWKRPSCRDRYLWP